MHIADALALRSVPAAGVFLTLTRRCPLTCAHCSTNSMLNSEEHSADIFRDFARSFTEADHPELVWLTGGEPVLRPDLVHEIVEATHAVGGRVIIISGLYFARDGRSIPPRVRDALLAVDHVVASQDIFHEVEVPRESAFAAVRSLVDAGQDVSFQIVGTGSADPYLAEVTTQIREYFDDRVPALVAKLGSVGRASTWLAPGIRHRDAQPISAPCTVAAWPVVTFDGTVVSCCQQQIVDGPAPDHLLIGSAPRITWPEVARTVREREMLRAIRTLGPEVLAEQSGVPLSPAGYCGTCSSLGGNRQVLIEASRVTARPTFTYVEAEVRRMEMAAGPEGFARMYGIPAYAHMVNLGHPAMAGVE